MLVDTFRPSTGVNPAAADPRGLLSYFVDTDFLDATDSRLEANRQRILGQFFPRTIAASARRKDCWRDSLPDHACPANWSEDERNRVESEIERKRFFFQAGFDAGTGSELKKSLNAIPTTFRPPRLDPAPREDYTPGTFRVGDVPIEPEREATT